MDTSTVVSIIGAVLSVGASTAVAWAKLTAVDVRMEERLSSLGKRFDDWKAEREADIHELRDDCATNSARVEAHGSRLAVLDSQVGSLRAMRAPAWRNGKDGP
jgi:hypothetical protein